MHILLVIIRIILAAFLGAIIGIEREIKNRAAGFRTHIIVSVGACLIMLIGIDGIGAISTDRARDTARIAGQVISGIGFLGAGTILQKKDKVSGLTTAAICLLTLISLKWVSDLINNRVTKSYIMTFDTLNFDQDKFIAFTSKEDIEVRKIEIIDGDMDDKSIIEVSLSFQKNYNTSEFFKNLKSDLSLKSVKLSG